MLKRRALLILLSIITAVTMSQVTMTLACSGGWVDGYVSCCGNPAVGVTVNAWWEGILVGTVVTDGNGYFDFGRIEGELTYTFEVITDCGTQTETVFLGCAQIITLDFYVPCAPGVGTPGYWKNHPDAWPVEVITICGIDYTRDEAIAILTTPGKGDKTYDLWSHLVAAKLNILVGNDDSCIADVVTAAEAWCADNPLGSGVKGGDPAWDIGGPLLKSLDDYNNGRLCAPKLE